MVLHSCHTDSPDQQARWLRFEAMVADVDGWLASFGCARQVTTQMLIALLAADLRSPHVRRH